MSDLEIARPDEVLSGAQRRNGARNALIKRRCEDACIDHRTRQDGQGRLNICMGGAVDIILRTLVSTASLLLRQAKSSSSQNPPFQLPGVAVLPKGII